MQKITLYFFIAFAGHLSASLASASCLEGACHLMTFRTGMCQFKTVEHFPGKTLSGLFLEPTNINYQFAPCYKDQEGKSEFYRIWKPTRDLFYATPSDKCAEFLNKEVTVFYNPGCCDTGPSLFCGGVYYVQDIPSFITQDPSVVEEFDARVNKGKMAERYFEISTKLAYNRPPNDWPREDTAIRIQWLHRDSEGRLIGESVEDCATYKALSAVQPLKTDLWPSDSTTTYYAADAKLLVGEQFYSKFDSGSFRGGIFVAWKREACSLELMRRCEAKVTMGDKIECLGRKQYRLLGSSENNKWSELRKGREHQ